MRYINPRFTYLLTNYSETLALYKSLTYLITLITTFKFNRVQSRNNDLSRNLHCRKLNEIQERVQSQYITDLRCISTRHVTEMSCEGRIKPTADKRTLFSGFAR